MWIISKGIFFFRDANLPPFIPSNRTYYIFFLVICIYRRSTHLEKHIFIFYLHSWKITALNLILQNVLFFFCLVIHISRPLTHHAECTIFFFFYLVIQISRPVTHHAERTIYFLFSHANFPPFTPSCRAYYFFSIHSHKNSPLLLELSSFVLIDN